MVWPMHRSSTSPGEIAAGDSTGPLSYQMRAKRSLPAVTMIALIFSLAACSDGRNDSKDRSPDANDSATTFTPATTEPSTTTTMPLTPEDRAAAKVCDTMHEIGVAQFVGDEPYDFPDAFEPSADGQISVVQCAINAGFRSVLALVITYTDHDGASAEFDHSVQGLSGEEFEGLGDRAWVDIPDATMPDKSAVVYVVAGSRYISVSNIAGLDNPPDRIALKNFAAAVVAAF